MENNEIWNSEEEQWFVKSFHETLSRLYAKEASHLVRERYPRRECALKTLLNFSS
ncbi:CRISPR-associated protein Cas8a1/Csx13, TIGR03486 subtype, C-terminal domain protein [Leptospira interrogans serovar Australis str. 200703203]|nr:CRISPR-associated protein Cas8a1/Csx13, TIGR03486 subtype, C-terminal domain protein [Leptospira interrogans serovar Australis str. 200703203]